MKVTLRFFSSLREQLGLSVQEHDTLALNVAQLRAELMHLNPKYNQALASGKAIRVAVNHEVCDDNALLSEDSQDPRSDVPAGQVHPSSPVEVEAPGGVPAHPVAAPAASSLCRGVVSCEPHAQH